MKRSATGSQVFVRGFDFGTTEAQLLAHMSSVGIVSNVTWITDGSAEITYNSAEGAAAALQQLNKTTIQGNSRFIDVMPSSGDGGERTWKTGGGKGQAAMAMGDPIALLQAFAAIGAKSMGKGGKGGMDPVGSGRCFVRGFDFATEDVQLACHMSTAGPVYKVHNNGNGTATIVFQQRESAMRAVSLLNGTIIEGNSRYIDVMMES
eukprot:TRINITY_DN16735_c1_g4_i1.p1 TRINITY_DN16735_c1_g4~~TRINITY_DN16735_c1_g4_i1.p1  ORF type:complete len:206 (-),score=35.11 TRINITY_DN16735_c1_g4_i1:157-774(-)